MKFVSTGSGFVRLKSAGFTLAEVVVALLIATMIFGGIIVGYVRAADRAEWSAYSLAAHSLAMQGVEQVRTAQWDPRIGLDELGVTNFMQINILDVPVLTNAPVVATNYISVSNVSLYPPLRQLRADCVWGLTGHGPNTRGPFTNTVITLRAPDQ